MFVHRSNSLRPLAERLAELLDTPSGGLEDPWRPAIVVVPSRGVERWLAQEIADRLGVAAHLEFPFPARFFNQTLDVVCGDGTPRGTTDPDPFAPEELVWHVARALSCHLAHPDYERVKGYLEGGRARSPEDARLVASERLLDLSAAVARVFDRYAVYRPEMLLEWGGGLREAGESKGGRRARAGESVPQPSLFGHGGGDDPEPDRRWQRALYRELVGRLGPHTFAARAKRAMTLLERGVRIAEAHDPGLPLRVSFFGVSTLPPLYLDLLSALSRVIETHLFVLSPSREYWAEIRSRREAVRADGDPPIGHPLLAAFGRAGREFQHELESRVDYREESRDLYVDPLGQGGSGPEPSLLAALKSDVLWLRTSRVEVDPADRSIVVHACHGPMREVEALHGALLSELDLDPTLDPDDIVVFVPDMATYAPFIDAVFGEGELSGHVPFRIAGTTSGSPGQPSGGGPLVSAFLAAVDVARGRMTAPEVTDLLAREPIRKRFELSERDLVVCRRLVADANVRWGSDEAHRASEGLARDPTCTWSFGLERLFLGVCAPREDGTIWRGHLPAAGGAAEGAHVLAALADFHATLVRLRELASTPKTVATYARELLATFDALVATADGTSERARLAMALAQTEEASVRARFEGPVAFVPFLRRVTENLGDRGAPPLGGGITFASIGMLRGVPFRIVALLGMDEAVFPRRGVGVGFDETERTRRSGDRTVKDDDRYAFLEALLAATGQLLLTYSGLRAGDAVDLAPSVCVTELLETIAATTTVPDVAARFVVRHPLQPFSPRYFAPSADPRLASYQTTFADAARALVGPGAEPVRLFPSPLPPLVATPAAAIALDDLVTFYRNPSARLFRSRLFVSFGEEDPLLGEDPLSLSAFDRVKLGDRVLGMIERGISKDDAKATLRAEGSLPPGALGEDDWRALARAIDVIMARVQALAGGAATDQVSLEISARGGRVVGTVAGLSPKGLVVRRYGSVNARDKLAAWIRHLALDLAGHRGETFLVGSDGKGGTRAYRFLPPNDARAHFESLLLFYAEGLRVPLPFFPEAAHAFAQALDPDAVRSQRPELLATKPVDDVVAPRGDRDGVDTPPPPIVDSAPQEAWKAARDLWESEYSRERTDPYVRRAFARTEPLSAAPALVWEERSQKPRSFGELAREIFVPLLDHLEPLDRATGTRRRT